MIWFRACAGRNDELALLYEKVKVQRNAIAQGEVAYRERLEDIRVLRCAWDPDCNRVPQFVLYNSRMSIA